MNRTIAVVFGGLAALAASAAYGQERHSSVADASYVSGIGPAADGSAQDEPRSPPLFAIGGLDVRLWAPVQPYYNGEANRDPAEEPLRDAE